MCHRHLHLVMVQTRAAEEFVEQRASAIRAALRDAGASGR